MDPRSRMHLESAYEAFENGISMRFRLIVHVG